MLLGVPDLPCWLVRELKPHTGITSNLSLLSPITQELTRHFQECKLIWRPPVPFKVHYR